MTLTQRGLFRRSANTSRVVAPRVDVPSVEEQHRERPRALTGRVTVALAIVALLADWPVLVVYAATFAAS
jgi:hypothetical protein